MISHPQTESSLTNKIGGSSGVQQFGNALGGDRSIFDGRLPEIPHISAADITPDSFIQHYRDRSRAVIITGLLEAEYPQWTLDFLCAQLGNTVFPVRLYGQERYTQDKRAWTTIGSGVASQPMPFRVYAEMVSNGEAQARDAYLARCSFAGTPLETRVALKAAEACLGLSPPATSLNLWVGAGGHMTCLHYDPMDGTLMQLHGRKHVLLFPPSQTYNLYPVPMWKPLRYGLTLRAVYSQVYPQRPDFEAFPRFREALSAAQASILNPGDVLFLPAGWWHEVISLPGSEMICSANRFWHVLPLRRSLTSWNKWRAHLGSVCAAPHVAWSLMTAIAHPGDRQTRLRTLLQRL